MPRRSRLIAPLHGWPKRGCWPNRGCSPKASVYRLRSKASVSRLRSGEAQSRRAAGGGGAEGRDAGSSSTEDIKPSPPSSALSRFFHESITSSQLRARRIERFCHPVEESRENGGTLYAGELEIRPRRGLGARHRPALRLSVREFGLLVAMAKRIGAILSARGALQRRVGRRAARRGPLRRRVRLQAAHQARSRDARPVLHPHPPRLRLPLPTPALAGRGASPLPVGPTADHRGPSRNFHTRASWSRRVGLASPGRAALQRLASRLPDP